MNNGESFITEKISTDYFTISISDTDKFLIISKVYYDLINRYIHRFTDKNYTRFIPPILFHSILITTLNKKEFLNEIIYKNRLFIVNQVLFKKLDRVNLLFRKLYRIWSNTSYKVVNTIKYKSH